MPSSDIVHAGFKFSIEVDFYPVVVSGEKQNVPFATQCTSSDTAKKKRRAVNFKCNNLLDFIVYCNLLFSPNFTDIFAWLARFVERMQNCLLHVYTHELK